MIRSDLETIWLDYNTAKDKEDYLEAYNIALRNEHIFAERVIAEVGDNLYGVYITKYPDFALSAAKRAGLSEEKIKYAERLSEIRLKYRKAKKIINNKDSCPEKLVKKAEEIIEYIDSKRGIFPGIVYN